MPKSRDEEQTNITSLGALRELLKAKRDRAYIIVLAGANVGEMHKLSAGEVVLGRSTGATIRLSDDGVSRKHAKLIVEHGNVRIEDLGSANGTLVNGERVDTCALKDGDQIQLGGTTILKFTYHDHLEEDFQRKMYDAALRDPMTRVFNKKHLSDRIESELAFARRHSAALSLIMMDVDHFKKINDTFGHPAGDSVLITLSQVVSAALRVEDMFARYGGEEFAVLCRGTTLDQAMVLAERIRTMIERAPFAFEDKPIPVTVSLGVTAFPTQSADTVMAFITNADDALYAAKRAGRNRVMTAGDKAP